MLIQIQNKKFKLKDSYNDFTLIDVKAWVNAMADIERLNAEYTAKIGEYDGLKEMVDMGMTEEAEVEAMVIESDLDFLRMQMCDSMITALSVACKDSKLRSFCENKVNYKSLVSITETVLKTYGDFVEYFNACPLVESFYHKGQKSWIGRTYKVHDMDRNTVLRDALATVETSIAFNYKLEISSGAWDNICKFVALVARPIKEQQEIAFEKGSFLNAKSLAGLTNSEKLTMYQKALNDSVEKRYKLFENLPLPIAIGVLRMYEKKKMMLG